MSTVDLRHRELLTVTEVARLLKLAPKTVRKWVRAGKLPAMRLEAQVIRFNPDKIERWLRGREAWH